MFRQRLPWITPFALLVLASDQLTKAWARSTLRHAAPISVIRNYLTLEYHENTGVAFSLGRNLPGGRYILTLTGILILFIVWRVVRNVRHRQHLADCAFGLISGGAIGNIIDRVQLGRVVDFIVMHWERKYFWPAYNIADASLCVGIGLLFIALGEPSSGGRAKGKRRK